MLLSTLALSRQAEKYLADYGVVGKAGAKAQGIMDTLLSQTARKRERRWVLKNLLSMKGNAAHGRDIFARTFRNCHKVGNGGFELGPALTDVGKRLKPREIIESILDSNAKIDPKNVLTLIVTDEDRVPTGVIAAETESTVTLKIPSRTNAEITAVEIEKVTIDERDTLKQSSMPEGLANSLAPLEVVDLLEYLRSLIP